MKTKLSVITLLTIMIYFMPITTGNCQTINDKTFTDVTSVSTNWYQTCPSTGSPESGAASTYDNLGLAGSDVVVEVDAGNSLGLAQMVSGFTAGAQYMFSITAARRTWEANNSQRAPIPVGVSVTVGGVSVGSVTRNNEDPASSTGNGIGNEVGFVWTTTILGPFTASATGSLCLQISATTALWYGGNNTSDGAGGKDISTTYGMAIQSVDIYPYVSTPVRLLYFKVVKDGSEVDINWQTASEINNDYFTVEKSINGIDFTPVATVDGAGNSQSTLNYQTTDYAPYNGISYYRLKQTDFDGTVSYSKIIAVNIEGDENINIYPNPGTGIFNIQGFGKESEITVHNPLGQTILIKRTFSDSSEIDLTSQPSGVYYIKTNNGDTSKSTKIILNK